jgi:hypothetical protein
MSNCKHRRPLKLRRNQCLNLLLCHHVNIGRCLIQHNHFRLSQNGSANANELSFPGTKILSIFLDFLIKAELVTVQNVLQLSLEEERLDLLIID